MLTVVNTSQLRTTIIKQDVIIRGDYPNHMLLFNGVELIGIVVSDVALSDDGVEYTCTTSGATLDFKSSLTLNVAGMYARMYIHSCVANCTSAMA